MRGVCCTVLQETSMANRSLGKCFLDFEFGNILSWNRFVFERFFKCYFYFDLSFCYSFIHSLMPPEHLFTIHYNTDASCRVKAPEGKNF